MSFSNSLTRSSFWNISSIYIIRTTPPTLSMWMCICLWAWPESFSTPQRHSCHTTRKESRRSHPSYRRILSNSSRSRCTWTARLCSFKATCSSRLFRSLVSVSIFFCAFSFSFLRHSLSATSWLRLALKASWERREGGDTSEGAKQWGTLGKTPLYRLWHKLLWEGPWISLVTRLF